MNPNNCIVIDNGSGWIKSGFSAGDEPGSVVPSVVTRAKGSKDRSVLSVGAKAWLERNSTTLDLSRPCAGGDIADWPGMEALWQHVLVDEVTAPYNIDLSTQTILLTDTPTSSAKVQLGQRQHAAKVMFETYNASGFYMANTAAMTLFATGRTTGVVVDVGESVTSVTAVLDGYSPPEGIYRTQMGAVDIDNYLLEMLKKRKYSMQTYPEKDAVAAKIREKLGYVALDWKAELNKIQANTLCVPYQLPDGQTIELGSEIVAAPEVLFSPGLANRTNVFVSAPVPSTADSKTFNAPSPATLGQVAVDQLVTNCIMSSKVNTRRDLYNNIVLTGGGTMMAGFSERLRKEITASKPKSHVVKLTTSPIPERRWLPWLGASILSTLPHFNSELRVTRQEYQEIGDDVVRRKCF